MNNKICFVIMGYGKKTEPTLGKTFDLDVQTSVRLSKLIPDQFVKISESGISDPASIAQLRAAGFKGFLIGETFMKTDDPGKACKEFIEKLK